MLGACYKLVYRLTFSVAALSKIQALKYPKFQPTKPPAEIRASSVEHKTLISGETTAS